VHGGPELAKTIGTVEQTAAGGLAGERAHAAGILLNGSVTPNGLALPTIEHVNEPPGPPHQPIQLSATIGATSALAATLTLTPFRVRLVEACRAALKRLGAKHGGG
jgi:hypothetical protein